MDRQRSASADRAEIQFHSSDPRRGVRTFALDRKRLALIFTVVALVAAVELLGAVVAPLAFLARVEAQSLPLVREQVVASRSSLAATVAALDGLRLRVERHRILLVKLASLYELPTASAAATALRPSLRPPAGGLEDAEWTFRRATVGLEAAEGLLGETVRFEAESPSSVRFAPSRSPFDPRRFVLVSGYGMRLSPVTKRQEFHTGIDLAMPIGTPVRAAADGRVLFTGRFPVQSGATWRRLETCVVLEHSGHWISLYGHLQAGSVRVGQPVRRGDVVGGVGLSDWMTAPALHFEIRVRQPGGDFRPRDPRRFLLDCQWIDEDRLLADPLPDPTPEQYDPLPTSLIRRIS